MNRVRGGGILETETATGTAASSTGTREVLGTEVLEGVVVVTLAGGLPWTSH